MARGIFGFYLLIKERVLVLLSCEQYDARLAYVVIKILHKLFFSLALDVVDQAFLLGTYDAITSLYFSAAVNK